MADLKASLIAYMRGQCDLETVSHSMDELLSNSPEKAPLVAELLRLARGKGLDDNASESLRERLSTHIVAGGSGDPDTTALPPAPEFTDTVAMPATLLAQHREAMANALGGGPARPSPPGVESRTATDSTPESTPDASISGDDAVEDDSTVFASVDEPIDDSTVFAPIDESIDRSTTFASIDESIDRSTTFASIDESIDRSTTFASIDESIDRSTTFASIDESIDRSTTFASIDESIDDSTVFAPPGRRGSARPPAPTSADTSQATAAPPGSPDTVPGLPATNDFTQDQAPEPHSPPDPASVDFDPTAYAEVENSVSETASSSVTEFDTGTGADSGDITRLPPSAETADKDSFSAIDRPEPASVLDSALPSEELTEMNSGAGNADRTRVPVEETSQATSASNDVARPANAEDVTSMSAAADDDSVTGASASVSASGHDAAFTGASAHDAALTGASAHDATLTGASAHDATLTGASAHDATSMAAPAGGDVTEGAAGDVNPSSPVTVRAEQTGSDAQSATSSPTWPSRTESPTSGAGITREFREGDRLRGRFQLISKLGEGGMGAVWKGLDKLKEEARDRNPYVAIKLLQGDFKEHPEAFIALQRETSKQQRLAHPNIATVYDFDRDDVTNTVFMTMEVLEGQPLDAFVRRLPPEGLSEAEAMPLIEQLCNGLAYAHSHGLVHSDLKPGNCFLTHEGNIKLLDFGIARASKTKGDAEGETTLFDPGELGALTPTYATVEMFNAEDPDPRDDIYALGIMSYQLLTGKHPFGRKSAPKAMELGLVPEPVAKLARSQNRALARSVAYLRDDRTLSVEQFIEDLKRKKSRAPMVAVAGVVAALITGGAMFPTATDWLDKREREAVVAALTKPGIEGIRDGLAQAAGLGGEQEELVLEEPRVGDAVAAHIAKGDERSITEGLAAIEPFSDWFQQAVRNREAARKAIFSLYRDKIFEAFDPTAARYNYAGAKALVSRLDNLYPDSAQVFEIRAALDSEKKAVLGVLTEQYGHHLNAGWLIPNASDDDISDVLDVVRQIDPEHRLLTDRRLPFAFAKEAEKAIAADDYPLANAYLKASATFAPNDKVLKDLSFQVRAELQRIANAQRVAEIEERLAGRLNEFKTLNDFRVILDDLVVLSDLSPNNPTLDEAKGTLQTAFRTELSNQITSQSWLPAEALLLSFAKLFDLPYLLEQRALLSSKQAESGFTISPTPERKAELQARADIIDTLLDSPKFSSDWELALRVPFKELIAMLPANDAALNAIRSAISKLYLEQAETARNSGSFSEALAFVEGGRSFDPLLSDFDMEVREIDAAKERDRLARLEEERRARIASLKAEFEEKSASDDVTEAKSLLDLLRKENLEAADDFVSARAPMLLSEAYQRRAASLAEAGEYASALTLAQAAYDLTPDRAGLLQTVEHISAEVERRKLQIDLEALFDSLQPLDFAATQADLARLESEFPGDYQGLRERFALARAQRLKDLASDPQADLAAVADRLDEFDQLFPASAVSLREQVVEAVESWLTAAPTGTAADLRVIAAPLAALQDISPNHYEEISTRLGKPVAERIRSLARSDSGTAFTLWQAARKALPRSADVSAISIEPPIPELAQARASVQKGLLTRAQAQANTARARYSGHSELPGLDKSIAEAKAGAERAYASYRKQASASIRSSDQRKFDSQYEAVKRKWSDRKPAFGRVAIKGLAKGQCHPSLAGYGKRRVCYDRVARRKGPELIVIPDGGGVTEPYAIGKFEVSVSDFNHYCASTKRCKSVRANTRIPKTNVSRAEAEAYAKWLSAEASKRGPPVVYRLPTDAEWEHAAKAAGKQPAKDYNCTVVGTSGQKVAGHALVSTRAGAANGWGLTNYVGNAQEMVTDSSGLSARGGTFQDPLDKCNLSIRRGHSGAADATTGFRLVRELG